VEDSWKIRKTPVAVCVAGLACLLLVTPIQADKPSADWSDPENVGPAVNSSFDDQHPAVSPDGLSLYFVSNRLNGLGGSDIWVSHREHRSPAWGFPVNIEVLNSTASEFAPAFSPSCHVLLFGSDRAGGCGGLDLWMSVRKDKHDDFGWSAPINLGCTVNSPVFDDGPAYFDDDETGLGQLYFISNRAGGLGDRDVWITTKNWDGTFSTPTDVKELNTAATESRPTIRRNGLELYFTSTRPGSVALNGVASSDVWIAQRKSTLDACLPPVNLGVLNTSATEAAPSVSPNARTLYFNSNRPGGYGGLDLYVTGQEEH